MGRLTKTELKGIVKECLIEILAEGLVDTPTRGTSKKASLKESILKRQNLQGVEGYAKRSAEPARQGRRSSHLDSISYNAQQEAKPSPIMSKAASITSDPILSEMLMDTAQNTFHAQNAAERNRGMSSSRPADQAAMIVENTELEDLFGAEEAGKWAALAFAN